MLVFAQWGDDLREPLRLWSTTRISENDNLTLRSKDTGIALMRNGDTDSRRLLKLNPPYLGLVTPPNLVKPTIGGVYNYYFRGFSKLLGLADHVDQSIVEAYFIFAYYDN
jgi:hypothetical protein